MKHNVNTLTGSEFAPPEGISILYFWADWHEPCKHLTIVFEELSRNYPKLSFFSIDAESSDLAEKFEVESVPFFVVLDKNGVLEKLEGANAPALTNLVSKYSQRPIIENTVKKPESDLSALTKSQPMMIFIKGTPDAPRCGFSRQLIEILSEFECSYGSFDILSDENVRQGLKTFSDWPTFPQVYINGEFIGGLDIVKELVQNGEFKEMIAKIEVETLEKRLKKLINKHPVMLFMKGNPSTPKCGFSRTIVGILNDHMVDFETFDILEDEEVRQGLKEYSDWPTFPQLYVKGELIGGLDIVKELVQSGEFESIIAQ